MSSGDKSLGDILIWVLAAVLHIPQMHIAHICGRKFNGNKDSKLIILKTILNNNMSQQIQMLCANKQTLWVNAIKENQEILIVSGFLKSSYLPVLKSTRNPKVKSAPTNVHISKLKFNQQVNEKQK